jgi:formamidopyrimidine-DNA glycosylase
VPELPEVESVRRAIAPALEGRRLDDVEISDLRLTRPEDPLVVASELIGERVEHVDRRGKYLIVRFASGRALLIHLRMTGSLRTDALAGDPHRRALLTLDDGSQVAYRDVRRFGTWLLLEPGELEPYLGARLGEEPLLAAFTAKGLGERLEGRRAALKAALLDQRTLAGLGNIYVDEALWYAKLHPLRPAGSLDREELRRLHRAIRKALELGIARQGSTLTDYRLPDGSSGSMQKEFKAYGRAEEPCDRCGTLLAKTRVAGRGTWFCPHCQVLL